MILFSIYVLIGIVARAILIRRIPDDAPMIGYGIWALWWPVIGSIVACLYLVSRESRKRR